MSKMSTGHKGYSQKEDKPQHTFMGWDAQSLPHIAFGIGNRFPAAFTKKSGMDEMLLKLLGSVMNNGLCAEKLSKTLNELHSLKYFEDCMDRECGIVFDKDNGNTDKGNIFSKFSN